MKHYYDFISDAEYAEAAKNGISKDLLYYRIRICGWDHRKAITTPKRVKNKMLQIAYKKGAEKGLSKSLVYSRFKRGLSLEEIINTPKLKPKEKNRKYPIEAEILCKKNGIALGTFRYRMIHGWKLEEACTRKTLTPKEVGKLNRERNLRRGSVNIG